MKQTRLGHVNQMSYFKTIIPYLKSLLCADQIPYENHDDPKHLSRVVAPES